MEPITTAAVAIGTIIATKALEKTTENVTDVVLTRGGEFIAALRKQSPETVTAIAKAPEQPLDYGEVISEVEAAASRDSSVKAAMEALIIEAEAETIPQLTEVLQEIAEALKASPKVSETYNFELAGFAGKGAGSGLFVEFVCSCLHSLGTGARVF
ncbi:hypothetical protein [Spirulina sp. 06S082]|uniref:hypothetical protein n=1 Tax=Spirulina sp. 06S082 TaxID=3110248 RepID=UPI002B208094|nr:hypothetical protein [Spirulina sp. 06S082]MEA5470883.1 hypothetical protein [Spirulina sp. 06S082]